MKRRNVILLIVATMLVVSITIFFTRQRHTPITDQVRVEKPTTTTRNVTFGMLPYGDHTYAIIGAQQGWFKDVGINLQYKTIKVEEIVPLLKNRSLDVVSSPPGILFAAFDSAPNLVSFVFGDLFQGYAMLGQPDEGFRSYSEFRESGLPPEAAVIKVVEQLRGRTFAYPAEAAIKPFIDLVLEKGGITRKDITSLVLDDPLTINAMRKKDADFQVGGVPSRIVLEREGFKVLLSSIDLALLAKPSAKAKELSSILQNGWATTREFYNDNHDDILRLASVNYRIMQFINDNPEAALAIHMPYLSKVSGQTFTIAEGKVIYSSLDPFVTFDDQQPWFNDTTNPLYYAYVNGAILNSFVSQGIYKSQIPTVDDVILADDVYRNLEELRASADTLFQEIEERGGKAAVSQNFLAAKKHYSIFNYLDAERLARKVINAD